MASPASSNHSTSWDESMSMMDPSERQALFAVLSSFFQYRKWAHHTTTHIRRQNFYALPHAHWTLLANPPFSFLDTLNLVDDAIDKNADLAEAILQHGLLTFQLPLHPETGSSNDWRQEAKTGDFDKARTTLRQFYRDWSTEGSAERDASLNRVIEALQDERSVRTDSNSMKVLVPGSGLSRLVFELSRDGFDVQGNEISFHMLLASSYILNGCQQAETHPLHPWIHGFSNHQSRDAHLLQVKIPDVCVSSAIASTESPGNMTMGAGDFVGSYGKEEQKDEFDAVACVFFLDTAPNIIRYLETIKNCLRPGGLLINFGPLLWHFEHRGPPTNNQNASQHRQDVSARHNGTSEPNRQSRSNGSNGQAQQDGPNEHVGRGLLSGVDDGLPRDDGNEIGQPQDPGTMSPGSIELTNDEVLQLVGKLGFEIIKYESGIRAPYLDHPSGMMPTIYNASFWVARKL